jgi:hypothetical protein
MFLCSKSLEGFVLPVFKENVGLMHTSSSPMQRACVSREPQATPERQAGAALLVLKVPTIVDQAGGPNKGVELTAYSVRSYVAPAFSSSSRLAFGSAGAKNLLS